MLFPLHGFVRFCFVFLMLAFCQHYNIYTSSQNSSLGARLTWLNWYILPLHTVYSFYNPHEIFWWWSSTYYQTFFWSTLSSGRFSHIQGFNSEFLNWRHIRECVDEIIQVDVRVYQKCNCKTVNHHNNYVIVICQIIGIVVL